MKDFPINLIALQHIPVVGTDLRMHQITRVSITVGPYGPFTKDFPEGQDSAEAITTWKISKKQEVQAIAG